jgi:hypothetical protein
VIAAIRTAIGERIPRAYVDLETPKFEAQSGVFPDPYALKRVRPEAYAAALLPAIGPPRPGQHTERIAWMAHRLREIEQGYKHILFVCSVLDWPWIRDEYTRSEPGVEPAIDRELDDREPSWCPIETFDVEPATLLFFLGELPFISALYERARRELFVDEHLSVDGIKELLLEARERFRVKQPRSAERITPQLLATYVRYVRNLCLIERRLTPDLYTLTIAAKQVAGDDFALAVAETARIYRPVDDSDDSEFAFDEEERSASDWQADGGFLRMGVDQAEIPTWGVMSMVNRLPGQSVSWRKLELRPRPPEPDRARWKQRWDPYGMCSWPPEDDRIESFHRHVRDAARAVLGADLARSEKFTASVRDGIDLRETLRNWHTGDLYVKVIPPDRGSIDAVVFLFETPAEAEQFPHRATWYAEHSEESTLAFYATNPLEDFVGPGIARSRYGGALFLFPPRGIPDIWTDPRLSFARTLEERLLAGACRHAGERHVAVVSPRQPPASWRRIARRYGRKLVHLPLKRFGGQMIERMRTFHILNGKHVRSYAAQFIRDY